MLTSSTALPLNRGISYSQVYIIVLIYYDSDLRENILYCCFFHSIYVYHPFNNQKKIIIIFTDGSDLPPILIIISMFTVTCGYLIILAKRMVHRLYYDDKTKKFTAIFYSALLQKHRLTFISEDVKIIDCTDKFMRNLSGNFSIKGHRFMLDSEDFVTPRYFSELVRHPMRGGKQRFS